MSRISLLSLCCKLLNLPFLREMNSETIMKYHSYIYTVLVSFLAASLVLSMFWTSCQTKVQDKLIVVSIAPERYFVEKIAGDSYVVKELVPPGVSPEEYDPTPTDIAVLSHSSLYFYVGTLGFEQAWIEAIRENNPHLKCVDISNYLSEYESDSLHTHNHNCADHHGTTDPHFWTSITGATAISKSIYEALIKEYPEDTQLFAHNYELLLQEIKQIEEECQQILGGSNKRAFVIYHPSLSYFAHEWGVEQLAIEENGKSPSAAHLQKLVQKAQQDSVQIVFVQQEFDKSRAETIAQQLGAQIYEIAPLSYNWAEQMRQILSAFKAGDK